MGREGLVEATKLAILNANYVARRLAAHYPLLYTAENGLIAHECIIDCRPFKASAGHEVDDIAKRIIDYGFHPPAVSFPVARTLLTEPTARESGAEAARVVAAVSLVQRVVR